MPNENRRGGICGTGLRPKETESEASAAVKLSDFRNLRQNGTFIVADVCVTRGIWPVRWTRTRSIARQIDCNWCWSDTWKFTPGNQAERLEMDYLFNLNKTESNRDTEGFEEA